MFVSWRKVLIEIELFANIVKDHISQERERERELLPQPNQDPFLTDMILLLQNEFWNTLSLNC